MNLAFDLWIPCVCRNGTVQWASLCACLTNEDIADLAVRPHERVALMRFLLCVAHAALGIPENFTAWQGCRKRLSEAVACYLTQWRDSFELFHPEKPFLQIAGLRNAAKNGESTPTSKLDFALASGNNSTLFDHEALNPRRVVGSEKMALDLLTFQMFSPGGSTGSVAWNGQTMDRYSSDAPCVPGSMLHTFVRGTDLPETVWLNLLSADCLRDYATLGDDWRGRPIWEMFPQSPQDEAAVRNATRTFLGRMVPLSRAVLLQHDGTSMLLGNGLTYPAFNTANQDFPPEPSATVVLRMGENDADERMTLGVQPSKSIWRQLHALTVQRGAHTPGGCLALTHADDNDAKGVDLVVGGLARDQANIVDVVESVFHVPAPLFRTEGHELYAHEVKRAEDTEREGLAFAMERWRTVLDGGWATRLKLAGSNRNKERTMLRAQASRDYWTSVERNLFLLMATLDALGTDAYMPCKVTWRKMLQVSALNAYTSACRGNNERQLRAFVAGEKVLFSQTNKILELHKEDEA